MILQDDDRPTFFGWLYCNIFVTSNRSENKKTKSRLSQGFKNILNHLVLGLFTGTCAAFLIFTKENKVKQIST